MQLATLINYDQLKGFKNSQCTMQVLNNRYKRLESLRISPIIHAILVNFTTNYVFLLTQYTLHGINITGII